MTYDPSFVVASYQRNFDEITVNKRWYSTPGPKIGLFHLLSGAGLCEGNVWT
jgi:hypothetical protein